MGRALAVFLWVMTGLSVWMLASGRWWFPKSISEHGPAYDQQFMLTIIVVGIAFVAAQVALGYALWRFQDTGDGVTRAGYSRPIRPQTGEDCSLGSRSLRRTRKPARARMTTTAPNPPISSMASINVCVRKLPEVVR